MWLYHTQREAYLALEDLVENSLGPMSQNLASGDEAKKKESTNKLLAKYACVEL